MYANKIILTFFILFLTILAKPQKLEYNLKFDGIADNREFFSRYGQAESILGSRVAISVGTTIDTIHKVRVGLSYFYEFGSVYGEIPPHLIMYYQVEKGKWGYLMGVFPRKEHIVFPYAMISEKYEYYKPTAEGLLVKYKTGKTNFSFFADWISRQDSVRREQFMAGFFGNYKTGNFIFEDYFYLFHNAGRVYRVEGEHMEDTMGACFLFGYDFSQFVPLDILTVKTGTLTSAYRNRGNGLDFDVNTSSYSEIVADYKGFGIEAFLKFGSQHYFAQGDSYFSNAKNYARTRIYFTPINFERVKGRFMYSLHFTPERIDHQQQFTLVYYFNNL
jgi:hypothetical protein